MGGDSEAIAGANRQRHQESVELYSKTRLSIRRRKSYTETRGISLIAGAFYQKEKVVHFIRRKYVGRAQREYGVIVIY